MDTSPIPETVSTSVLIIGAGGAGLRTSIELAKHDIDCDDDRGGWDSVKRHQPSGIVPLRSPQTTSTLKVLPRGAQGAPSGRGAKINQTRSRCPLRHDRFWSLRVRRRPGA
ncbi:MAG: hypothetical protein BRD36_00400 [Bacteroidetes bacterium QH_7_64_110]|nr:MAG: hypothetical protein BRD36_00400 [Bacteroidetes bacterium QH_7_64_110]